MRTLFFLLFLCSCVVVGEPIVAPVNGVSVTVKSVVPSTRFVAVQKVRIYHGVRNDTGEDCAVISGDIVTRLPHRLYDVDITVEIYRLMAHLNGVMFLGSATATVKQAPKGAPAPFRALCTVSLPRGGDGKLSVGDTIHVTTSFKIRNHVPSAN
jgi:hypothetical protein